MFCMNCGLELPEDAKFCRECAMPLTSCVECGEDLPKRAKFCWKCGKPQRTTVGSAATGMHGLSGLGDQEEGTLHSDTPKDPEGVLPQHSESAMRFMQMNMPKPAAEAPAAGGAVSPFKPAGSARRESNVSSYNAVGAPSAFKPASEKKSKDKPGAGKDKAPSASGPFKPIESKPSAPSARVSASPRPSFRPGAGSADDTAKETSRPASQFGAAPRASAPAAPSAPISSAFKPIGSANNTAAASRPAVSRPSASGPAASSSAASRPAASQLGAAPRASAPAAPSAPSPVSSAFKPLAAKEPEKPAPKAAPAPKAEPAAAPSPVSSAFKPLGSLKQETQSLRSQATSSYTSNAFKPLETKEPEKTEPASPLSSSFSAAFKPFAAKEPEKPEVKAEEPKAEEPKSVLGFASFLAALESEDIGEAPKRPGNPGSMFHMNSNSGPMSSLGGDSDSGLGSGSMSSLGSSEGSLSSSDDSGLSGLGSLGSFGSLGSSGSLGSDSLGGGDEGKLHENTDSSARFFPRPAANTVTVSPKPAPRASSPAEPSPFRPITSSNDDQPYVREPGASPFKPLNQ